MESSFYFDEKTQTWVDGSAPAGESNATAPPPIAPPIAPMASTGAVVARDDSHDGSPSAVAPVPGPNGGPPIGGSPRATSSGLRSRYVDVFARDGSTTAPTTDAAAADMRAFVPSAAPIGGFGGAMTPTPGSGVQFFVPAPRAAEEGDDARERFAEPLALMRQPTATSEPDAGETVSTGDGVDASSAAAARAIESIESTETPAEFGGETPAEFGGGDAGAPEMGVYDDWATIETSGGVDVDENVDAARWDASGVDPMMATETETETRELAAERAGAEDAEDAARPVDADARVFETATPSTADHRVDAETETHEDRGQDQWTEEQRWDGYEGHEEYEYDPRWKYDDAAGEWYWDGGDAGAPEMGVYDDWATVETSGGVDVDENVDAARWDASGVDPMMATETEAETRELAAERAGAEDGEDAARPVDADARVFETATPSTADHHVDAETETHEDGGQDQWTEEQRWDGYEGHEEYEYDPRWKYDDAAGEWYWDGGDDADDAAYDDWIERSAHDAAVAELQSALDAKTVELDDASATRETLMEELRAARETSDEARARLASVSAATATTADAVDEAYARGKEDGYREGYAVGSAEAREELEDLLVCLGQEGRRVEKLREMLAETGADMDAVIAEFELEEEEEMARLIAKETTGEMDDGARVEEAPTGEIRDEEEEEEEGETNVVAEDAADVPLPEISQSLRATAAEIDTPERVRDYRASSLDPDAEEFILPTPPKASKHDASERNLAAAFELA